MRILEIARAVQRQGGAWFRVVSEGMVTRLHSPGRQSARLVGALVLCSSQRSRRSNVTVASGSVSSSTARHSPSPCSPDVWWAIPDSHKSVTPRRHMRDTAHWGGNLGTAPGPDALKSLAVIGPIPKPSRRAGLANQLGIRGQRLPRVATLGNRSRPAADACSRRPVTFGEVGRHVRLVASSWRPLHRYDRGRGRRHGRPS